MSVVVEFTLPADSFPFGRATGGDPDVWVRLERLVPLKEARIPFLWVSGERFDRLEQHLADSPIVARVEVVTELGDNVLYYVEWNEAGETFLSGLSQRNGTIMEARGDSQWSFTVRFRNHRDLTHFHQFYQDEEFPVHIDRVYAPDEGAQSEYGLGLTPQQRDTLILAVEKGYFSVPRDTKLEEISEETGITKQAASGAAPRRSSGSRSSVSSRSASRRWARIRMTTNEGVMKSLDMETASPSRAPSSSPSLNSRTN